MLSENLRFKRFKVMINNNVEYVKILDSIITMNGYTGYLVEIVGEYANHYKDGREYRSDFKGNEREIITPNKGMIKIIYPFDIIEIYYK